jgi:hypothetical protein
MTDSIQVEDLRHWRALASTNDRMTYHVGMRMADRLINRVLNERANLAWRMMREGSWFWCSAIPPMATPITRRWPSISSIGPL